MFRIASRGAEHQLNNARRGRLHGVEARERLPQRGRRYGRQAELPPHRLELPQPVPPGGVDTLPTQGLDDRGQLLRIGLVVVHLRSPSCSAPATVAGGSTIYPESASFQVLHSIYTAPRPARPMR